jgi:phosphoribosyl 1,2-cyclic phosphodiesterase
VEYGGNTSCLEIRAGKRLIIVDLGTGVKPLGDYLIENDLKDGPLDIDIFVTHTHWDHIMGFPMFAPNFLHGTNMRIWGPSSSNHEPLASIIGEQLSYKYWPVNLEDFAAEIEFREIGEETVDLGGGLVVKTKYLNHPIHCLSYRFEYEGKSIVCADDHEPFPSTPDDEKNDSLIDFFKGSNILVHDAQYLGEEYEKRVGWGHSSFELAIRAAERAGVEKLAFFHHDPVRKDSELRVLEEKYTNPNEHSFLKLIVAREGLTIEA